MFGDVKEWHPGQLALLSHFGYKDFSVVKIVREEDVVAGGENYEFTDRGTIYWHNPFGGMDRPRGDSVPVQVIRPFGFHAARSAQTDNGFHLVGPQNLYRSIDALIQKELRVIYPDLVIQFWQSPQYTEFVREFPRLKERNSVLDQIDYQTFDVQNYSVIVVGDPRSKKHQEELRRGGYPHPIGVYYFAIPELNARSTDLEWVRKERLSENGRFTSVREALAAAEKYIDYLFYSAV